MQDVETEICLTNPQQSPLYRHLYTELSKVVKKQPVIQWELRTSCKQPTWEVTETFSRLQCRKHYHHFPLWASPTAPSLVMTVTLNCKLDQTFTEMILQSFNVWQPQMKTQGNISVLQQTHSFHLWFSPTKFSRCSQSSYGALLMCWTRQHSDNSRAQNMIFPQEKASGHRATNTAWSQQACLQPGKKLLFVWYPHSLNDLTHWEDFKAKGEDFSDTNRRAIFLDGFHGNEEIHLNQEFEMPTIMKNLAMLSTSLPVLIFWQNFEK